MPETTSQPKGVCHSCNIVFDLSKWDECIECGGALESILVFNPMDLLESSLQARVAYTECTGNDKWKCRMTVRGKCGACDNTSLKWPLMTIRCWRCPGNGPEDRPGEIWGHPCPTCNATGRRMDVTLEKVLDAAAKQGDYMEVTVFPEDMWRSPEGIRRELSDYKEEIKSRSAVRVNSGMPSHWAEDPVDAACEALLESPRSGL